MRAAGESSRLSIRPVQPADAAENYQAMVESREELQRWMSWAHPLPSQQQVADYIAKENAAYETHKPQGRYMACLKENGNLAVSLGITVLRRDIRRYHVSYWTRRGLTGQGYATEALIALSRWLFDVWQANRIDSGCAMANEPSRHVLEKAGYCFEGTAKNATHLPPDGVTDELIYAVTDIKQLSSFSLPDERKHAKKNRHKIYFDYRRRPNCNWSSLRV